MKIAYEVIAIDFYPDACIKAANHNRSLGNTMTQRRHLLITLTEFFTNDS